jgi:Zn-dependent membrane protease YugP
MFFGPYMWLIIPGLILGIYAQIKLSSAYGKYSQVGLRSRLSGAQAAREILDNAGLPDVPVEEIDGHLTDHYDPSKRALFLSAENYEGQSVAAVGVAAHEAGHALQHQASYAPLKLRMAMVPVTNFASVAWVGLVILGMILGGAFFAKFIWIAVAVFAVTTFFQLVTLPVEFDASNRAKAVLLRLGLVHADESHGVSQVLNAAALTYVAALVTSILQLLRLLMIARDRD